MTALRISDDKNERFTFLMPSVALTGISLPDVEITPQKYLQYATLDLEEGTDRGAINALGSAKRALHLIVDSLLHAYGLLARNPRASFPKKLELIDGAGLFSLSILGTLNLERNVMEHGYRVPDLARVREMVDVGRLLALATHGMARQVPYECLAGWQADQTLGVIQLDPLAGNLSFFRAVGPTQDFTEAGRNIRLLEPIRTNVGRLRRGVEIDPDPVWNVGLTYRNMAEWRPLLQPMVKLAVADTGFDPGPEEDGRMQVSLTTTASLEEQLAVQQSIWEEGRGQAILDYSHFTFGFTPPSPIAPDQIEVPAGPSVGT
jgi:hypothetical protein